MPILVHLFSFRKSRKVFFTAVRFLNAATSNSRAQSKVRYYLILGSRILMFSSVCLLMFLHFYRDKVSTDGGVVAYFYDNSISNSVVDRSKMLEFFEAAKAYSSEPLDLVVTNGSRSYLGSVVINDLISFYTFSTLPLKSLFDSDLDIDRAVIISDFQKKSLEDLSNYFQDSTKSYHVVLSTPLSGLTNVFVDTLFVNTSLKNSSFFTVSFNVHSQNFSNESLIVKLLKGGEQVGSVVKDASDDGFVSFDIPRDDALGIYMISLGGDEVSFDNVFYFSLSNSKKPKVVIVDPELESFLSKLYRNELFDVYNRKPESLNYDVLNESDIVIFNNLERVPVDLISQISDKPILILPADSIDETSYSDFFDLSIRRIAEYEGEVSYDVDNPLLSGVFDNKEISSEAKIRSKTKYAIDGKYDRLIRYRNGSPLLLKKGNVYFLNTLLDKETTFQTSSIFLPLMYKLAYLHSGTMETPYYYPGDRFLLPDQISDLPHKLVGEGVAMIPSFTASSEGLVIEIPQSLSPGIYYLVKSRDTLKNLAVNVPKSESDMSAPSFDELEYYFRDHENVSVYSLDSSDNGILSASSEQASLWKYALVLILSFVILESMLHKYAK